MAANPATVVGIGGTTVTLNFQTASNALIAQKALGVITGAVTSGGMQEVSYSGGSTLPAAPSVPGVVLAEGTTPGSHTPFELSAGYKVAISNDTTNANPQGVVVGVNAQNDQVFIGGGGGGVVNFGINTEAFFSGSSSLQSFQNQGFLGLTSPTAELWVDGTASVDGSAGATTTHLDTTPGVASVLGSVTIGGFGNQLTVTNNGNGHNTVNIANSTVSASGSGTVTGGTTTVNGLKQDVIFLTGSSSVATTVNASGSTATVAAGTFQPELWVVANGGSGVINGGAQAILAFSSGNGVLSVNGGTAAGDIDVEAAGFFKSGSGGGAIMASNPTLATTLVGGGNNDIMFGLGNNTTMIAGAGTQTEASFATGGETFMGNLGAGASTTTMITEISGGNKFITGNGVNDITALGGTNTFSEGVTSTAGGLSNAATIHGLSASDTISLAIPGGGGTYTTVAGSTATATQIAVSTSGGNSVLHFGDGTTWTVVGVTNLSGNFH